MLKTLGSKRVYKRGFEGGGEGGGGGVCGCNAGPIFFTRGTILSDVSVLQL